MDNTTIRVKKYLEGTLSAKDKVAFEEELRSDKNLMKEFILYGIRGGVAEKTPEQIQFREQMAEKFANADSLPEPKITWRFYLRNIWYSSLRNWIIITLIAFLGIWVTFNILEVKNAPSLNSLIQAHVEVASCGSVAGDKANNQENNYLRSAEIYCSGQADEEALQALEDSCQSEFCMSCYYLAHVKLEKEQYQEASKLLQRCIDAGLPEIEKYPFTVGSEPKIRLNILLAELSGGKPLEQTILELENLLREIQPNSSLHQKGQQLLDELKQRKTIWFQFF